MKRNDPAVIEYRILKYLFNCMKKNEWVDEKHIREIGSDSDIDFVTIAEDMKKEGLVDGFAPYRTKDGLSGVSFGDPRITVKGIDYLKNNSLMKKIEKSWGRIRGIVPGL